MCLENGVQAYRLPPKPTLSTGLGKVKTCVAEYLLTINEDTSAARDGVEIGKAREDVACESYVSLIQSGRGKGEISVGAQATQVLVGGRLPRRFSRVWVPIAIERVGMRVAVVLD